MSSPPPPNPPSKKEVMLALLDRAEARVHLDARHADVQLPERFRAEPHLRLDYGYGFQPPIPDLAVDDDGISATLSFNRQPFRTFVPWAAVYLIADFDGNGAVWQEDIPGDLKLDAPPPSAAPLPAQAEAPPPAQPEAPPKKPRPSHLKLVK
jgi:hypothetical protein